METDRSGPAPGQEALWLPGLTSKPETLSDCRLAVMWSYQRLLRLGIINVVTEDSVQSYFKKIVSK